MRHKVPEYLDILEAVYELYLDKGKPKEPPVFTLYGREIGGVLQRKGFTVSDSLVYQRLDAYNTTIEIKRTDSRGGETATYWLCGPDLERQKKDNDPITPLQFQMGTVANEIAALMRKRQLEEEQRRFWNVYKWAATATIALMIVTAACTLINCWITYHRP